MSRSRKVALTAAAVVAAVVGLVAVFVAIREGDGYDSPDAAVTASCHAAHILGDYSVSGSRDRIGWQPRGEAPGIGWTALVERGSSGKYEVTDCKFQRVVHG